MTAREFELLGELEGELEEEALEIEPFFPRGEREADREWPDPPVDKDSVSGCETPGRPFDDFAFRSAAVPAKHGPRIKDVALFIVNSWVQDPSLGIRTVCLEGHTDNVGPRDVKDVNFNMRLGLARAKNLAAALKKAILDEANRQTQFKFGKQIADSVTILVSSQGKANPVAPNTTPLGRRRNRRVRFAFSS